MRIKSLFFLAFVCATFSLSAQNTVEWRNDRTGVYNETGLMKLWSARGPELLWHFDGLGRGFTSVSIADNRLFITGETNGRGSLFVLGMDGKLIHKIEYGSEFTNSHPGARNTVIPNDGKIYLVSGTMELFCYDIQTMQLLWKKITLRILEPKLPDMAGTARL